MFHELICANCTSVLHCPQYDELYSHLVQIED